MPFVFAFLSFSTPVDPAALRFLPAAPFVAAPVLLSLISILDISAAACAADSACRSLRCVSRAAKLWGFGRSVGVRKREGVRTRRMRGAV